VKNFAEMRLQNALFSPPTTGPDGTPLPVTEQVFVSDLYVKIAARRAPLPLLPNDLTIVKAPPVAEGYNALLAAIRTKTIVARDAFDLCVCRVAVLNSAKCEWEPHVSLALVAGISMTQLKELKDLPCTLTNQRGFPEMPQGSSFTNSQWKLLIYTDAMTRNVDVDAAIFEPIKSLFEERERLWN
jgi:hypothetical protein